MVRCVRYEFPHPCPLRRRGSSVVHFFGLVIGFKLRKESPRRSCDCLDASGMAERVLRWNFPHPCPLRRRGSSVEILYSFSKGTKPERRSLHCSCNCLDAFGVAERMLRWNFPHPCPLQRRGSSVVHFFGLVIGFKLRKESPRRSCDCLDASGMAERVLRWNFPHPALSKGEGVESHLLK